MQHTSLSGYQLTWFYFGFSRVYAILLGLMQVAGATLLLFRKDHAPRGTRNAPGNG